MQIFKVAIGAASFVVAAESAEEIKAHTAADKIEAVETCGDSLPLSVADLPVITPVPENVIPLAGVVTGGESTGLN